MKKNISKTIKIFVIIFSFIIMIFPFYWLIITSLKPPAEIYTSPLSYVPLKPVLDNYINAFSQTKFFVYIVNSIIVTLISSTLILFTAICGGYALARYDFKLKRQILMLLIVSQMVPLITAIIPIFSLYSRWGLIDSLWSLVLSYTVGNIPFCLITMSSFFKRIPKALEEAAKIDGCSRIEAAVRVILPITLPGIIAVFVFAFTGCWNEMFYSIMMINSESKRTIPVGLMNFVQKTNVDWGQMCAAAVVTLLPVTVLFFAIQKYIVAGLTAGAVKE
ncbi:MAG: carbohydrate ABC transporter permease [Ruminiclostridium sp.]